jgi:hypothetical protein
MHAGLNTLWIACRKFLVCNRADVIEQTADSITIKNFYSVSRETAPHVLIKKMAMVNRALFEVLGTFFKQGFTKDDLAEAQRLAREVCLVYLAPELFERGNDLLVHVDVDKALEVWQLVFFRSVWIATAAEPEVIIDICGRRSLMSPFFFASRKSRYVTTSSHAIRSLCVPVGFLLSSFSQTFLKPGTLIWTVGVAGKAGLSGGNSGFRGSFSDATRIEYRILLSCSVSPMEFLSGGWFKYLVTDNCPVEELMLCSSPISQ